MLSQDEIKKRIFQYINQHPGCNGIQLAINSNVIDGESSLDIPEMLECWIDEKEIVEVEYVLPKTPLLNKSLYFPKNSNVSTVNAEDGINILVDGILVHSFPLNTKVVVRGNQ